MYWQQLFNALTLGATYALVAVGYTLVFGVLRVLNLAHGEMLTVGAFAAIVVSWVAGPNLILSLAVGAGAAALLGALIVEPIAIRPVQRRNELAPLITTIGLSILLTNLVAATFGPSQTRFPQLMDNSTFHIGPVIATSSHILNLGVAMSLMVGLSLFLRYARIGKAIRAVAENPDIAEILGVDTRFVSNLTVTLASALGGIAGVLIASSVGAITPFSGGTIGMKGLVAVIIGGMTSPIGGVIAAFGLALVEVFSISSFEAAGRHLIPFLLICIVILYRPQGLFSRVGVRKG